LSNKFVKISDFYKINCFKNAIFDKLSKVRGGNILPNPAALIREIDTGTWKGIDKQSQAPSYG